MEVVPDAITRLVRHATTLHATHTAADPAPSESRLMVSCEVGESADEHARVGGLAAVAVQAAREGSRPLRLLHVEEVLVGLVGHRAAKESRRQHARVEGDTVDDAREAGSRSDEGVHGGLEARKAVVVSADVEARVGADRERSVAVVAGPGSGGHCCWRVGLRKCVCVGWMSIFLAREWPH